MKVLLIYTNRYRYLTPPPLGLTFLIPSLQKRGHEVRLLDMMFQERPANELSRILADFHPGIVGFSIRNLDNQYMLDVKTPLPEIQEWVSLARKAGAVTVLGGTAFTTLPREMLAYMDADYGISGQGEDSLPCLIEALENKTNISDIPGIVFRDGNSIIATPAVIRGYPDGLGSDWSFIDFRKYRQHALLTPFASVVVKTGCPYNCSFCNARTTVGRQFRFRGHDMIINEIRKLKRRHNAKWFFLVDNCFNSPLDHAKLLLERMIHENLGIRFITRLDPIPLEFDDEFFSLYRKAGGYSAQAGFHSFSQTMLSNYQAPFAIGDIEHFGKLANQYGIRFGAELLFGGPGETHTTIRESMEFLPRIPYSFVTYAIGLRISPHTALYQQALHEGVIQDSTNLLFPKFYVSQDIDVAWVRKYINSSLRKYGYRQAKMLPLILRNLFERLA
jgi:radical SAM superfamily enzyme YgiQ (UPF0313 family)